MNAQRREVGTVIAVGFEAFVRGRTHVANLRDHISDRDCPVTPGITYPGSLWIADHGCRRFSVRIGARTLQSADVRPLEARLYQHGLDSGVLTAPQDRREPAYFAEVHELFDRAGLQLLDTTFGGGEGYGWHDRERGVHRYGYRSVLDAELSGLDARFGDAWASAPADLQDAGFVPFLAIHLDAQDLRDVENRRP